MQRYVSILYEDDLDRTVKKYKKKIVKKFNSSFEGCEGKRSVCFALIAFLMSCAIHHHRNTNGKIEEKMFYPSLLGVDLYDVWDKIGKNLIYELPSIDDYINNKKVITDYSDNTGNLVAYMDDYCSYIIEARLFNGRKTRFLDINDEEIIFFCKMCIGEFLSN